MSEGKGIVISGLSGRFPNSNNVDEFWDNLVAGKFLSVHKLNCIMHACT